MMTETLLRSKAKCVFVLQGLIPLYFDKFARQSETSPFSLRRPVYLPLRLDNASKVVPIANHFSPAFHSFLVLLLVLILSFHS